MSLEKRFNICPVYDNIQNVCDIILLCKSQNLKIIIT